MQPHLSHWAEWNTAAEDLAAQLDIEVRARLQAAPPVGVPRAALEADAGRLVSADALLTLWATAKAARQHVNDTPANRCESRIYDRMLNLRGGKQVQRGSGPYIRVESEHRRTPGEFSRWRIGTAAGQVYRGPDELSTVKQPRLPDGRMDGGALIHNEHGADLYEAMRAHDRQDQVPDFWHTMFLAGPVAATGLQTVAAAAAPWVAKMVTWGARLVVPLHFRESTIWSNVAHELELLGFSLARSVTPAFVLPDHPVRPDDLVEWIDEVFGTTPYTGDVHFFRRDDGPHHDWSAMLRYLREHSEHTKPSQSDLDELERAEHRKAWFWSAVDED